MAKIGLKNIYTALITPYKNDCSIDYEGLKILLKKQEASKVDGIVLLSTTGEGSTLNLSEAESILKIAKENFSRDIIIGISENDLKKIKEKMQVFDKYQPLCYLITSPFYNKGNEKGIYKFYMDISSNSNYPFILYNVPSRTGYDIPLNVIKKLKKEDKVWGIKNASYNYKYYEKLAKLSSSSFKVLCGNDNFFFVGLCLTSSGIISVLTNIIPNYISSLFEDFFENFSQFKKDYFALEPLFSYLEKDVNPIMIKELIGHFSSLNETCRLPLSKDKHFGVDKLYIEIEKNGRISYECNHHW